MANTFKWEILHLDCYPRHESRENVVCKIRWRRAATDGKCNADILGEQLVTLNSAAPFTPFNDLTFEQVCGWLENAMGAEKIRAVDANLVGRLVDMNAPPAIALPLPWTVK